MSRKQTLSCLIIMMVVFLSLYSDALSEEELPSTNSHNDQEQKIIKKPAKKMPFYVYNNAIWPPVKSFCPSGYMGDIPDIKMTGLYKKVYRESYPALKVTYSGQSDAGWIGVIWQNPPNNWGELDGGYNLSKASKLTFWAKGDQGGEVVEFKVGGILSVYADSAVVSMGEVTLVNKWVKYTIDLSEADLRYISGGFCFIVTRFGNPNGCIFYMDDIKYEK